MEVPAQTDDNQSSSTLFETPASCSAIENSENQIQDDHSKEEVVAFYKNNDISLRVLARKFNKSEDALRRWGLKSKRKSAKKYTAQEKSQAIDLYNKGNTTTRKLAVKLDIPDGTLRGWIKLNEKKNTLTKSNTDEQKKRALELYRRGNISKKEVARQVFVPVSTVSTWLKNEKNEPEIKTVQSISPTPDATACSQKIISEDPVVKVQSAVRIHQCGISSFWQYLPEEGYSLYLI